MIILPLRSDLIGVRHPIVWSYLLLEEDSVVAVDTGLGWSGWRIRRWFKQTGRRPEQLRAIVLTHGHLDHAGCAAELQAWSGAKVYLHEEDVPIAEARHGYRGWSRVAGTLEALARPLYRYRPPRVDAFLSDGDELPYWGGLRVIHLPGHTAGHVALHAPARRILFVGDAILSLGARCCFPMRIFNADHQQVRQSILRLADIDVDWVYPMHHRLLRHNLMDDIRRYAKSATR